MPEPRVVIVDYGLANIQSVVNAVECFTPDVSVAVKGEDITRSDPSHIILPGVGSFDECMRGLNGRGHSDVLHKRVKEDGVPFLGICVGFQLVFESSDEGTEAGLGWIPGHITAFPKGDKAVPHMGWNTVHKHADSRLFAGLDEREDFYFVHSYYGPLDQLDGWAPGTAHYITDFAASLERDNIAATQFHPEKSQLSGLKLLENFLKQ